MKMVSYAQNGEDVMLSRALRGVAHGFYVDVGAAGPTEHSVTRAFYERGWTGINIEPTERFFTDLTAARPHDVNLRVALDDHAGEAVFHVVEGTGLSTLDAGIADAHKPGGWPQSRAVVPTRTLADVCAEYAPPAIHFLKVDVEGAEDRVLRGADFARFRPWIVLVEATRPLSPEPDYAAWEPLLTAASYEFVWFDGINRFYLAGEKAAELRRFFAVPVNYFDDYDLYSPEAERLRGEIGAFRAKADAMEAEARSQYTRAEAAENANSQLRARTDAAEAEAATARAAANAAGAAARSAETLAQAADSTAGAARRRVEELRQFVAELSRQLDESRAREAGAQAAAAAQRHDYEVRLSAQHQHTHDRRLAQEHAEAVAADLAARLQALQPPAPVPAPALPPADPAPPRRNTRTTVLHALYRTLLRPVVRPVMWRTRSFFVNAVQHEQRLLGEHQQAAFNDLAVRADRTEEAMRRVESALAPLRALVDRPSQVAQDLSGLAQSLEAAVMTLAVTARAPAFEPPCAK